MPVDGIGSRPVIPAIVTTPIRVAVVIGLRVDAIGAVVTAGVITRRRAVVSTAISTVVGLRMGVAGGVDAGNEEKTER